jgi:hypothetical protein
MDGSSEIEQINLVRTDGNRNNKKIKKLQKSLQPSQFNFLLRVVCLSHVWKEESPQGTCRAAQGCGGPGQFVVNFFFFPRFEQPPLFFPGSRERVCHQGTGASGFVARLGELRAYGFRKKKKEKKKKEAFSSFFFA